MIPYGRQQITEDDIARVADSLRQSHITTGPLTVEFEQAVADYVGAKHAVAVCNATAALHLAMMVAEIGPGDRIVTSTNTFLASANCGAFVGATPDFADIDPVSYNLCPKHLAEHWIDDTKAVVPVHYSGGSADVKAIHELAQARGAVVIEDACHAIGGKIIVEGKTYPIGGHPFADITTFSFHPVKTMTTGEGGVLVTDNDEYASRARRLRTHGMVRQEDQFLGLGLGDDEEHGPWYYEMQELGYNFRITDFQCALGLGQLERLDQRIQRRRDIVARYNEAFAKLAHVKVPGLRDNAERELTSWHLYTVQIDFESIGKTRTELMNELKTQGVGTQVLYIPVHLQPFYRKRYGYGSGKCPVSEQYYGRALSLPLFPAMTDEDVEKVIQTFSNAVSQQSKASLSVGVAS